MPTRRERMLLEERRAQQQRRQRQLAVGAGVLGMALLLALAVVATGVLNPPAAKPVAQAAALTATCSDIQTFPTQSRDHIQPNQPHPPYSSNPPTSGWHWDTPQDWGIYTTPQVQEQLVHNLEHGGIVVQYNDLTTLDAQRLTDFVKQDDHHVILAPYPGLPKDVRVAFTAWDHLQTCNGVDASALRSFINAFRDKGPEQVP